MAVIATKEALSRSRYRGEDLALILYGGSGIQGIPGGRASLRAAQSHRGTAAAVGIGRLQLDASRLVTRGWLPLAAARSKGRIDRRRRQLGFA
jgi:hypothetical protein